MAAIALSRWIEGLDVAKDVKSEALTIISIVSYISIIE